MSLSKSEIENKIRPVLKQYGIKSASLVGSTAREEHSTISDIDLIIEIDYSVSLLTFARIKRELETLLEKKVDLIERSALKTRLKQHILRDELQLTI